jgi:hypothetical protein
MSHPPPAENPRLDIGALSRMFGTFTNSYKFLFFQSILTSLKKEGLPDSEITLSLRSLAIEIAVLAWYPKSYFHLEFGPQDQLGKVLENISPEKANSVSNGELQNHLRQEISHQHDELGLSRILLRYVPFALLKSFFEEETRKLEGTRYERAIVKLSCDSQRQSIPLYRFRDGDNTSITIPKEWARYLATHFTIIEGWAKFEWAKFLQKRNPNVPAILEKLAPPGLRRNLRTQTAFWNNIAERKSLKCIYSGNAIIPGNFDLDHFIPWSYVGHDELWNLIPVHRAANRSKGNRLPAPQYLTPFISLQSLALRESHEFMPADIWKKAAESHVTALKMDYPKLLQKETVESMYTALIEPLMAIARQIGFAGDWKFT